MAMGMTGFPVSFKALKGTYPGIIGLNITEGLLTFVEVQVGNVVDYWNLLSTVLSVPYLFQ